MQDETPRFDASAEEREQLADSFLAAAQNGDFEALEALLAEDVELHGDGGGFAPAIKRPAFGRRRVAQMLSNWMRLGFEKIGGVELRRATINGQPGAEYRDADGKLIGIMSLDIAEGRIQAIRSIVNPQKLGHLGPVADPQELLRRMRETR